MRKKRRLKYKNIFLFIIGIICFVILIYTIINMIYWHMSNKKNDEIKDNINKSVKIKEKDSNEIDWDKLTKQNEDAIAYIKINGTKIDYVVVKGNDNKYYLNHNFNKEYSKAGWIFVNYKNKLDGNDKNITLFGHARLDGSMFGTLKDTLKSKWQNDNKNHTIIFMTKDEKSEYQVFSTYKIKEELYYIKSDFSSDDEFLEFINTIKSRSNYDYNIEVNSSDTVLTLSSCDIVDDYRIVLHAKKIIND